VPLFRHDKVVGALAVIFFASAVSMKEAETRFVEALQDTARAIAAELGVRSLRP